MSTLKRYGSRAIQFGARKMNSGFQTMRAVPLGRVPQWRRIDNRFDMYIDPRDYMDREFYFGLYERHLVRLVSAVVRQGDVCVDVGAQKGFVTLHLATCVGREGRILAFEPDPRAMETLSSNVSRNGLKQVSLYPWVVAANEGVCTFGLSDQLGWSTRYPNPLAAPTISSTISVRTRALDDVISECGLGPAGERLSFMKIDAEGSEPLVLQGAINTIRQFHPTIHLEVNKSSLIAAGSSADFIETLLRSVGYELYRIELRRRGFQHNVVLSRVESLSSRMTECEDVVAVSPAETRRLAGSPAGVQFENN